MIPPMAQVSGTTTEADHAPARRRRRRGLELAGVVIGLAAGVSITLAWLVPVRSHHPSAPVAPSTQGPVLVAGSSAAAGPDPAALDAEWVAYSDRSDCADWAGGDGVSAIRLNSAQLAWFYSDSYIGPAGPAIGFSQLSGFVHNAVVVQTTTGRGSTFVTMTGGGACTGPGGPGDASPVVGAPPTKPGGPYGRWWEEDGIKIGQTVVKFYNHYRDGGVPFVPLGTAMAAFPVSQLSSAGRGPRYGAVARPDLIPLPSYTPPAGGTPILWGAAVLRVGNTVYVYGTQTPDVSVPDRVLYLARVPASRLTAFSAWRFYTGRGRWAAGQRKARPVQPATIGLDVSSGFSVVKAGQRYWLIQADPLTGASDIDAYPGASPWGPFDSLAGKVLYRDPAIGLDAAHDYRVIYEARAEPALSTPRTLVISYNVNSDAVTTGCVPLANYTNAVTQPRFITVPVAAFDGDGNALVNSAKGGPQDYPRIVSQDPSQWFDELDFPGGCPPVPGLAALRARPGAGRVTLSWPDAGLGLLYRVYLQGPADPVATKVAVAYGDDVTVTGLPPGSYRARVVPVNFARHAGPAAGATFTVP
jgi:hypothetical protein